jgi:CheY-like chemotaxis protein
MQNKILIVDDDPDIVLFLTTLLTDHGYETDDAPNGEVALEKISENPPSLILLDLMMPKKSGIALLSELRKDEKSKDIPIIMVTGVSAETGIDLESFLKGSGKEADLPTPAGYVEKPVEPEKLLTMIQEVLN